MVRPANTVRSRGCIACRKKRIKCDLGLPSCQRCVDSGWVCSGPETGLFIINVDSRTYKNPPARKKKVKPTEDSYAQDVQFSMIRVAGSDSVYDDALLWKFFAFFSENAGRTSWLARLPNLAKSDNATAIRTAARAVSLAYAAHSVGNPSATAVACQFYGQSLHQHRLSLEKAQCLKPSCPITVHALSVTVLLSYFEMIFATSADAWIKHTQAAEKLLVTMGPDAMEDELVNHLFFMIRSHAAVRSFLYGGTSELSHSKWLGVPFISPCGPGWQITNAVLDLAVWLSERVSTRPHRLASGDAETDINNVKADLSDVALTTILNDLQHLWDQFGDVWNLNTIHHPLLSSTKSSAHETFIPYHSPASSSNLDCFKTSPTSDYDYYYLPSTYETATLTPVSLLSTQTPSLQPLDSQVPQTKSLTPLPPLIPELQNPGAALTAAFFHTAAILLLRLARYTNHQLISNNNHHNSMTQHSTQILVLASYLSTQHIGCTCARTMLPIVAVHRFSPLIEQRVHAQKLFAAWCQADGLPGLICVAFPELEKDKNLAFDMGVR